MPQSVGSVFAQSATLRFVECDKRFEGVCWQEALRSKSLRRRERSLRRDSCGSCDYRRLREASAACVRVCHELEEVIASQVAEGAFGSVAAPVFGAERRILRFGFVPEEVLQWIERHRFPCRWSTSETSTATMPRK